MPKRGHKSNLVPEGRHVYSIQIQTELRSVGAPYLHIITPHKHVALTERKRMRGIKAINMLLLRSKNNYRIQGLSFFYSPCSNRNQGNDGR